jgi:hypothetical protein
MLHFDPVLTMVYQRAGSAKRLGNLGYKIARAGAHFFVVNVLAYDRYTDTIGDGSQRRLLRRKHHFYLKLFRDYIRGLGELDSPVSRYFCVIFEIDD